MIRVVHLFDVKKGVDERAFIEWLDQNLEAVARRFGCVERKSWLLVEGFTGDYTRPSEVRGRPRFVNEAYWNDMEGPREFRKWMLETPEGRKLHDKWFGSIQNHTVLRYTEGWSPIASDE